MHCAHLHNLYCHFAWLLYLLTVFGRNLGVQLGPVSILRAQTD